MPKLIFAFILSLMLAACGDQTDSEPATADQETDAAETPAPVDTEREAQRETLSEPEQRGRMAEGEPMPSRDELRERMRERRAEITGQEGDPDRHERLRQRRVTGTAGWWQDAAMAQGLGLSESQQQSLDTAHQAMEVEREAANAAMANTQRLLMLGLREGEREQIESLLDQRAAAAQALNEIELRWQRELINLLDDDQLRELASQNPQALIGRQRMQ